MTPFPDTLNDAQQAFCETCYVFVPLCTTYTYTMNAIHCKKEWGCEHKYRIGGAYVLWNSFADMTSFRVLTYLDFDVSNTVKCAERVVDIQVSWLTWIWKDLLGYHSLAKPVYK